MAARFSSDKRAEIERALFYTAFFLYTLVKVLEVSNLDAGLYEAFSDCAQIVLLILLGCKIVLQNDRISHCICFFVIAACLLLSWRKCGNANLVWMFAFYIAARNVNFKGIAKASLAALCIALFVVIDLFLLEIAEDVTAYRFEDTAVRHSFGFSHPNTFGWCLLGLGLSYSIVRFDDWHTLDGVFLLVVSGVCWFVARSVTSTFLILLLCILVSLAKMFRRRTTLAVSLIVGALIFGFVAFSIVLAIIYNPDNSILHKINSLISGRLNYSHYYWELDELSFWGANWRMVDTGIEAVGHDGIIVDNAYVHVILVQGIVAASLFAVSLINAWLAISRARGSVVFSIALVIVAAFGLFETAILSIAFSYVILFPRCVEARCRQAVKMGGGCGGDSECVRAA